MKAKRRWRERSRERETERGSRGKKREREKANCRGEYSTQLKLLKPDPKGRQKLQRISRQKKSTANGRENEKETERD